MKQNTAIVTRNNRGRNGRPLVIVGFSGEGSCACAAHGESVPHTHVQAGQLSEPMPVRAASMTRGIPLSCVPACCLTSFESKLVLAPQRYAWDADPPVLPGPDGQYPIPTPGVTNVLSRQKPVPPDHATPRNYEAAVAARLTAMWAGRTLRVCC